MGDPSLAPVSVPTLDDDEVRAILHDAARALAARGWSAKRLASELGLPLEDAEQAVERARSTPT